MQSLKYAFSIIDVLKKKSAGSIYQEDNRYTIPSDNGVTLVGISDSAIEINGTDISDRLHPQKKSKLETRIGIDVFEAFMQELSTQSEVTLNHLGISYYCKDLDDEVSIIKELLGSHALYEEDCRSRTTKWLFIGNTSKPDEPLFELVLNERTGPVLSSWVPHFQIDIDTTLNIDELKEVIKNHLGDNWIKWSIDVEGWGTPLVMGRLCSLEGTKVYLAIGTNVRDRIWHRREALHRL